MFEALLLLVGCLSVPLSLVLLFLFWRMSGRMNQMKTEVDRLALAVSELEKTGVDPALRNQPEWQIKPEEAAPDIAPVVPEPSEPQPARVDVPPPAPSPRQPIDPQPAPAITQDAPPQPTVPGRPPVYQPILDWFLGVHVVVRVGIVLLFIGVALLFRFAVEQGWLSLELRLLLAGALGLVLLLVGWQLREKRRTYAFTLQGGGFGIMYITVYASFRLYELLPPVPAFAILLALVVVTVLLALMGDSLPLAAMAISGGFLAPILASTGQGSHVTLFALYLVLNLGILAIAWFKAWRVLNLLGFLFTFAVGSLWGAQFYQPVYFASVEPFLIVFFLFYLAIGLLFARRQPPDPGGYVDGPLIFGPPVVVFALQSLLVADFRYGAALSAVAAAVLYLGLAIILTRGKRSNYRELAQVYGVIGTIFATLAVPLAFGAQTTTALWALEGAGLIWFGVRWPNRFYRAMGGLVQLLAGFAALIAFPELLTTQSIPIVNTFYLGTVLISLSGLLTAYWLGRTENGIEGEIEDLEDRSADEGDTQPVSVSPKTDWRTPATLWGLVWWYGGAAVQTFVVVAALDSEHLFTGYAAFAALSSVGFELLRRRLDWRLLGLPLILHWALAMLLFLPHIFWIWFAEGGDFTTFVPNPFVSGGWYAWPLSLAAHYLLLRRREGEGAWVHGYHAIGLWSVVGLATSWIASLLSGAGVGESGTFFGAIVALPTMAVLAVMGAGQSSLPWPIASNRRAYLWLGGVPLAGLLSFWLILYNLTMAGDADPWPFIPLLNPADIASLLALGALTFWLRGLSSAGVARAAVRPWRVAVIGLGFLWLNASMARIAHQLLDVPFTVDALLGFEPLQAAYSLVWGVLALGLMLLANRRARRWIWMVGGVLLAITVVKLFVIDLSGSGTVARIVSFIGVGILMLVIGYFAPAPPQQEEA